MHAKPNLPSKDCVVCGRPFTWRRKWARTWSEVKYCSTRCRSMRWQQLRTQASAN